MPRSMTAYGSAEGPTVLGHLRIEMRTVNHRFLEISTKLPEDLRPLEPLMRERIGARLSRGKLDLSARLRSDPERPTTLTINHALLDQLTHLVDELTRRNERMERERSVAPQLGKVADQLEQARQTAEPARAACSMTRSGRRACRRAWRSNRAATRSTPPGSTARAARGESCAMPARRRWPTSPDFMPPACRARGFAGRAATVWRKARRGRCALSFA